MTFEDFKKEVFANDPELKREYDLLKEVRLIDANTFDVTYNRMPEWTEDYSEGFDDGVLYALGKLDDAETIDAVPVVRCKDCKRCKSDDLGNLICDWTIYKMGTSENNYCSCGKRKDDNE